MAIPPLCRCVLAATSRSEEIILDDERTQKETMTLTPDLARTMISAGWRPLPGRSIIALDSVPTMSGLIHIPESAQRIEIRDAIWPGMVLAVTPRREWQYMPG